MGGKRKLTRKRLHNRRHNLTIALKHGSHTFFIGFGFDDNLRIMEVFGNSAKLTSDMDFLVSDACIVISIALQYGISPAEMLHSAKMMPDLADGKEKPASLIGVILNAIVNQQNLIDEAVQQDDPGAA